MITTTVIAKTKINPFLSCIGTERIDIQKTEISIQTIFKSHQNRNWNRKKNQIYRFRARTLPQPPFIKFSNFFSAKH